MYKIKLLVIFSIVSLSNCFSQVVIENVTHNTGEENYIYNEAIESPSNINAPVLIEGKAKVTMLSVDKIVLKPGFKALSFTDAGFFKAGIKYYRPLVMKSTVISATNNTLGSISIHPNGGIPPYTYLWESGDTYSDLYDCWPGEYKVVLTDHIGNTLTSSLYLDSPIRWINMSNVSIDSPAIKKNNSTSDWDAGASSASLFRAGANGQVFYRSESQVTRRAFGLAKANEAMTLNGMTYAFYFNDSNVYIYENGTLKKDLGIYAVGETFKIIIEGSDIKYYRGYSMERTVSITAVDLVPRVVFHTDQAYFTNLRTSSRFYSNIAINTKSLDEGYTYDVVSEGISSTESTGIQSAFWVNPIAVSEDRLFSLTFHNVEGQDHTFVRFEMDNTYTIKDVEIKVNSVWQAMAEEMYNITKNSISFYSSSEHEEGAEQQTGLTLSLENGEVLTPDGDESYDVLEVSGINHVRTYQIIISDVQGNTVYTSTDINVDWDGVSDVTSSLVPIGTYRYQISVNDIVFNGLFNVKY